LTLTILNNAKLKSMPKLAGLICFILALLTACVPNEIGSSRFNPIDATTNNHARVTAGKQWFINIKTDGGLVNLSSFDAVFPPFTINEIQKGAIKRANVNWLSVVNASTPENWSLELAAQQATRTITEVGLTTINLESGFELTFAIKIPANTPPDTYLILVFMTGKDKPTEALPIVIEIEVVADAKAF
jgi:hypothetical protein